MSLHPGERAPSTKAAKPRVLGHFRLYKLGGVVVLWVWGLGGMRTGSGPSWVESRDGTPEVVGDREV